MTNALRHGQPRHVVVDVWPEPGCALRVTDDGVGVDESADAGFGQRAMVDLAHQIDAAVLIGQGPAGGTRVEVLRR